MSARRLICEVVIWKDDDERVIDRFRLKSRTQELGELEIIDIMAAEAITREPPEGWRVTYRGNFVSEQEWCVLPAFQE